MRVRLSRVCALVHDARYALKTRSHMLAMACLQSIRASLCAVVQTKSRALGKLPGQISRAHAIQLSRVAVKSDTRSMALIAAFRSSLFAPRSLDSKGAID
jgi:hypothetical protein